MSATFVSSITTGMASMTLSSDVMPDFKYRAVMQKYKDATNRVLNWFEDVIPQKEKPAMGYYPTLSRKVVESEIEVPISIIYDLEAAIEGRTRCYKHHQQLNNSNEEHEYILDVLYEIQGTLCPKNPMSRPEGLPVRIRRNSFSSSRSESPPSKERLLLENWRTRSASSALLESSSARWVSPTATAKRTASSGDADDKKKSYGPWASANWRNRG